MPDRVKTCPSCNHSDKSEAYFEVCPRCGLIVAKYLQRKRQNPPENEFTERAYSPDPGSIAPSSNRIRRNIAAAIFCLSALFIASVLTIYLLKTRSGTILWSHQYIPVSETSFAHAMAIDGDFLYIVGSNGRMDAHDAQWSMEKRKVSDGELVLDFGEGGLIKSGSGPRAGYATGVAVDSQYLYVIGTDYSRGGRDLQWHIEKRRSSDGSLVEGFGDGGSIASNSTPYFEWPKAIVIDADFMYVAGIEITVTGNNNPPGYRDDYQWRIEKRYLSDGSLASDFGAGGVVKSNPNAVEGYGGSEEVNAIAIGADSIFIVGQAYNSAPMDTCWRIEKRRLSDGSLSAEFGTDGIVMSNPSPGIDSPFGIAVDDKYVYAVGFDTSIETLDKMFRRPENTQWRIEKRAISDGSFAVEFGNNGVVTNNPSIMGDRACAIVLDRKPGLWERILNLDWFNEPRFMYVAGRDETMESGPRDPQWRIEKRKSKNGAFCSEFGKNGVVNINPSARFEEARLIAADADHIYVVGFGGDRKTSMITKIKK